MIILFFSHRTGGTDHVNLWTTRRYISGASTAVGFLAFIIIAILTCIAERTYSGPKLWDAKIEPKFGTDPDGEASDACLNYYSSGHTYCSFCCCFGLCRCLQAEAGLPTRRELWNAAASLADEDTLKVAERVLARSAKKSVVDFSATYYPDTRCSTWHDCLRYSATLECFAADDFCCCQTDESTLDCCFSFCPWRKDDSGRLHLTKFKHAMTPLRLACKNEKVKLATILFDNGADIWARFEDDGANHSGIIHQLAASGGQERSLELFQMFAVRVKDQNQEYAYSPEYLPASEQTADATSRFLIHRDDTSINTERTACGIIPTQRQPCSFETSESVKYSKLRGILKTYIENKENTTYQEQAKIKAEMIIHPIPARKTYTEKATGITWIMLRGSNGWNPLTFCKILGKLVDDADAADAGADDGDDVLLNYAADVDSDTDDIALLDLPSIEDVQLPEHETAVDADVGKKNFQTIHWLDFRDSRGKTPIDVARDNGHTELEHAMIFERHPEYIDRIIRDASASASQLCIQDELSEGGRKRQPESKSMPIEDHIKTHGAALSNGLLQIASRRICKSARHMEPAAVQILGDELTARIKEVLGNPDDLSTDVPLPRQLRSIKQFLLDYVQVPLYYGDCTIDEIPLAFRDAIFNPIVEIIRHHCASLLEKVQLHPDHFIEVVAELAIPDARSYDAQRLKSMSKIFGNGEQQFDDMLKGVDVIYDEYRTQTAIHKESILQPTGDPLKLTVMLRNATSGFKLAIKAMATLQIRESANGLLKDDRNNPEIVIVTFRPMCKGLYRVIEKCLLKSKKQDTLNKPIDCSKVKDAAGCFISCKNFKTMHDVMNAIYNNDQWKVCELKNSWTGLSKAGWRDYKVIVQFPPTTDGLLFEIQIALEHMVRARNFLDGHAAYAAFRNYYECIKYLGKHEQELNNAVSPDTTAFSNARGVAAETSALPGPSSGDVLQTLGRLLRPVVDPDEELKPVPSIDAVNLASNIAGPHSQTVDFIDPRLPRDEKLHIMRQMLNTIQATASNMEEDGMETEINVLYDYVASLQSSNFTLK